MCVTVWLPGDKDCIFISVNQIHTKSKSKTKVRKRLEETLKSRHRPEEGMSSSPHPLLAEGSGITHPYVLIHLFFYR